MGQAELEGGDKYLLVSTSIPANGALPKSLSSNLSPLGTTYSHKSHSMREIYRWKLANLTKKCSALEIITMWFKCECECCGNST